MARMERNPRGRPRHPDVLTPAEWRVLEQLREGGTNAEIAARLGISLDAVKYHVSNMLGKLGLQGRHELAAWRPDAGRRRLLGLFAVPAAFETFARPLIWASVTAAALAGAGLVAVALVVLEVVVEGNGAPPGGLASPASPTVTPAAELVPSPVGSPAMREACTRRLAVHHAADNPGLVNDCAILLEARDFLAAASDPLDWSRNRRIDLWQGVTVSGTPPRVTALSLGGQNLRGLPSILGKLAVLEALYLGGNELTGEIPSELASLTNLRYLDLGHNQLTGGIPSEFTSLTNLRSLDLGQNQLTGGIPSEFTSLTNLRSLDLGQNQLTGSIPPSLASLGELRRLDLSDNDLAGDIPAELSSLQYLRDLRLLGNGLSGCIPLSMRRALSDITQLGLTYCECPASSPGEWPDVSDFATDTTGIPFLPFEFLGPPAGRYRIGTSLAVDLPDKGQFWVRGPWDGDRTTPITITETNSHSYLTLDPLTGTEAARGFVDGPPGCLRPSDLFDEIVASATLEIPNPDPDGTASMGLNQTVDGGRSYRLDTGEWFWWRWPAFVIDVPEGMRLTLVVVRCRLDVCGYGLELEDEASGSTLSLDEATGKEVARHVTEAGQDSGVGSRFDRIVASVREDPPRRFCGSDPMPPDCALLMRFKETFAGDASLNWGVGVEDWDGVHLSRRTGRVVALSLEGLTGHVPAALGELAELEYLRISEGQLTGEIPRDLGTLTNLRTLDLNDNRLTGEIPPELGALPRLERLDLSRNELTGKLPPELGSLVNLQYLYVSDNRLTGEVPSEFGSLLFLIVLNVDRDRISGAIPPGLGRLSYLVEPFFLP